MAGPYVTVTREPVEPKTPPLKSVTITLDPAQANDLLYIAGRVFSWSDGEIGESMVSLYDALSGIDGLDCYQDDDPRIAGAFFLRGAMLRHGRNEYRF